LGQLSKFQCNLGVGSSDELIKKKEPLAIVNIVNEPKCAWLPGSAIEYSEMLTVSTESTVFPILPHSGMITVPTAHQINFCENFLYAIPK
jgi:hypothetical protein